MHRLRFVGFFVVVSTACGSAPPPKPAESTAFVQDPARPNIVYGIEGTLEGAPEVGLTETREITLDGAKMGSADPKHKSDALGRALQQKKSSSDRIAYAFD